MSEMNKKPVEVSEDELEFVAGGTNYPADWDQLTIDEKRARMVMSVRLRELGQPCEFDD